MSGPSARPAWVLPSFCVLALACTPGADDCAEGACNDEGGETGDGGETGTLPGEDCEGMAIDAGGALDLDLGLVKIVGSVTLAGGTMPDWSDSRGSLVFNDAERGVSASFTLGPQGAAGYGLSLPPGSYDISFVGNPAACLEDPATPFPCNSGVVMSGVELNQDAALDIDVQAVTVTGIVTVNGSIMPDTDAGRGQLAFVGADDSVALSADFGLTGPGAYELSLLPGSYRVDWVGNPALCNAGGPPCNVATIQPTIALEQSGQLDLDVEAVTVLGAVTVNGQAMPAASDQRGNLVFVNEAGGAASQPFGASGAASYEMRVVPGTYDLRFDGNEALCAGPSAPDVPCNDGVVAPGVALTSSGNLDVDVPRVKLSGTVTVNGAAMPDEAGDRGALAFVSSEDASAVSSAAFGNSGAPSYGVALLPGTYTVELAGNPGLCSGSAPGVPCMSGSILTDIELEQDAGFDVDIPAVTLAGVVTVDGVAMPDWPSERGNLSFIAVGDAAELALSPMLGATGPAAYALTLLPNSYDVHWSPSPGACADGPAPFACVGGPILEDIAIEADGNLDVDMSVIELAGNVTLEGATLPDIAGDRGTIGFRQVGGGSVELPSLGMAGPASYALSLLPGRYVITHSGNAGLCTDSDPPDIPCAPQVLAGCD